MLCVCRQCRGQVHNIVVGRRNKTGILRVFLTHIVPDKMFNDLGQPCRYAFFVHNKASKLIQKVKNWTMK